jgi:hypothetical protein
MIFVNVPWVTYLIAVLLPVLVAVVTAKGSDKAWGAWLLAFFAAVTAVATEAVNHADTGYSISDAALLFLTTFTIAVAVHYGFWKATGITGDEGKVRTAIPGGLGAPSDFNIGA